MYKKIDGKSPGGGGSVDLIDEWVLGGLRLAPPPSADTHVRSPRTLDFRTGLHPGQAGDLRWLPKFVQQLGGYFEDVARYLRGGACHNVP